MPVTLSLQEVYELSRAALMACGANEANAVSVARSIREAEAEGIRNVGLAYLPYYCDHVLCGKVDGQAQPELKQTTPAALLVDAKHGFAHAAYEALDADGRPTTDPNEGLKGSIAPLGGYKGAGLALLVEVLAAGLVGANWSFQASPLGDNEGGPPNIGQLFIAIDGGLFGAAGFDDRLETLVAAIHAQEGTRLPGDGRLRARRKAEAEGVSLDETLHARMMDYAERATLA